MTNHRTGAAAPGRHRASGQKAWRARFLARLAETSNVTAAAEHAGISLSRIYQLRREDRAFANAWRLALYEGYELLELDLLHRLRFGDPRDADGRKFDNGSAFRLLVLHREAAARERARREDEDEATILASIDAKIAAMRVRDSDLLNGPRPPADENLDEG